MEFLEKVAIFLSMFDITSKKIEKLLEIVEDEDISTLEEFSNSGTVMNVLSSKEYHSMLEKCDERLFSSYLNNLEKDDVKVITKFSDEFPSMLRDLPDAPVVLYAKGDVSLLNQDAIAVVGSRKVTNYGRYVTDAIVDKLARAGFVIVSGLAYGIDGIAHRKALQVGGKTIAVLGGGFNNIYPSDHNALANEIAEKGLLLSEYCPSVKPATFTFPRRNRIIAALAKGTVIPEAGKGSGTIYTKDYALSYGRDLFAVPGNINSEKSDLPNMLIKSAQAECVLDGDDILKYYGIDLKSQKKKQIKLSIEEQMILDLLRDGERDFDFLAKNSNIPVNILNSCLTTLEISGLIRRLPAKTFMLG